MAHQFVDLPLIPQVMDDHGFAGWAGNHLDHIPSYRFRYEDAIPTEDLYSTGVYENGIMMNRFMQEPYPLTTGFLDAKFPARRPLDHQYDSQFPAMIYDRHVSPSASGYSSDLTQSEHHSPHVYYAAPYGSPTENTLQSALPYPTVEHPQSDCYMTPVPHVGGCNLRDLEYTHAEPERMAEEKEDANVQAGVACEPGHLSVINVDTPTDNATAYPDSGIGNSPRDAESVQPELVEREEDTASDSDYSPSSSRSGKRRRSSTSNGNSNKVVKRRGSGRKGSGASNSPSSGRFPKKSRGQGSNTKTSKSDNDRRSFPCPLSIYGCRSNFGSKNEWKRHVSTQHIKLSFWRCNLCPPTTDPNDEQSVYYNDFNRIDLFTQHLRRMHSDVNSRGQKTYPINENNIQEHKTSCLQQLRQAPQQSTCLFCDKTFEGPTSWDERMEHVGKHFEKDRGSFTNMLDMNSWIKDPQLEHYLVREGLIVQEDGQWRIGDGKTRRNDLDTSDSEEE